MTFTQSGLSGLLNTPDSNPNNTSGNPTLLQDEVQNSVTAKQLTKSRLASEVAKLFPHQSGTKNSSLKNNDDMFRGCRKRSVYSNNGNVNELVVNGSKKDDNGFPIKKFCDSVAEEEDQTGTNGRKLSYESAHIRFSSPASTGKASSAKSSPSLFGASQLLTPLGNIEEKMYQPFPVLPAIKGAALKKMNPVENNVDEKDSIT